MRIRLLSTALVALTNLISSTAAIYASQVGQIDWHEPLIGIPWTHSSALAPRFHRVGGGGTPAQAVYLAATERNVLAALNPSEGNLVWRRHFEEDDNIIAFKANSDGLVSLSGNGGATVRIFEVINGNLIWETHLHDPSTGHLAGSTPDEPTGAAVEFDAMDVFVLSNGHTIRRLQGATGDVLWGWTSPDVGSSVFLTNLVRTSNGLYALGISKNLKSLSIHVISLDPTTGAVLHSADIPSSIKSQEDFFPVKFGIPVQGPPLAQVAAVAWLESGSIKQVLLTPSLENKHLHKAISTKYGPFAKIQDLGIAERGYVTGILEGKVGAAQVYRLEHTGLGLNKVGEFDTSDDSTRWAIFAGGTDRKGDAYIAKFAHSSTLRSTSYEVFVPAAVNGRGMTTGFTFAFDTTTQGVITFAAIDVVNTAEYVYASRLIVSTSTGGIMQFLQEKNMWSREESLSEVVDVKAVDLPELSTDRRVMYRTGEENWQERIVRQLGDITAFPSFLFHFFQRFLTGAYASASAPPQAPSSPGSLWRDTYGFKKVIVAATKSGNIFGIETGKGKVVWAIKLGAKSGDLKMKIKPVKLVVLKTVSEGLHPELGLVVEVTQQNPKGEITTTTGMVRIDATAGTSQSSVIFRGPALDVMELDLPSSHVGGKKIIGMVDYDHKVHIYPYHADAVELFNNLTNHTSFMLSTGAPTSKSLQGYSLNPIVIPATTNANEKAPVPVWDSYPTWRSSFPAGENVISVTRRIQGTPVSHGRVLADQSTLYKYSNPHLIAVVTESHAREHSVSSDSYESATRTQNIPAGRCAVYLMDSIKGTILYESNVPARKAEKGKGGCDIKVSLVENWLVWHYYDDGSGDHTGTGTKGWRMVSVELYEGGPDDKTKSAELSKDHPNRAKVTPIEQVFIFPGDIKAMTTTTTKFGISTKDLVVINAKGQIQTYSHRVLDPRRPVSKPSAAEAELGLTQYDVLLPFDPRRVVSHNYNVIAAQLYTMPTQLESTSLVLAFGLDMFLTRVAPSGTFDVLSEGFNKIQLVCTVVGLGLGIGITKRLVASKGLKARWYS